MKKGVPTITIPVQKVSSWADHGESSESIANKLGITVEDLNNSLDSLAEKNRKSAQRIRQRLAANDKRPKPNKHFGAIQAIKPVQPAVTSVNPYGFIPTQASAKQSSVAEALKATTSAQAETAKKAAPTVKKTMSTEAEALQLEVEKAEKALDVIDQTQADALAEIEKSKAAALQHEQTLKELAQKLKAEKAEYEAQMSKLNEAEQVLISCEGRRVEQTKRLAELKARLHDIAKPEIYVCDGEIQAENVAIPEDIDVSGWAQIIDMLPESIGSELRKKDAELLIRLRAIMKAVDRDDAELAFDNDVLQRAYEAIAASETAN